MNTTRRLRPWRALLLAALVAALFFGVSTAQVTEPLPATIAYVTDGKTAHVSWMDLGPLNKRYLTNRTTVIVDGDTTIIRHELILKDRLYRTYFPRVEN